MRKTNLPPVEELRQLIDYDPETGRMTWKWRPRSLFDSDRIWASWNTKWAGMPALRSRYPNGYLGGRLFNENFMAHRVAWALGTGKWPEDEIDHLNHDKADNRLANLRVASKQQNTRNMPLMRHNTSGVTGVYWHTNNHGWWRWVAIIQVDKKRIRLGNFHTKEEAIAARRAAEIKYGFHENHGR